MMRRIVTLQLLRNYLLGLLLLKSSSTQAQGRGLAHKHQGYFYQRQQPSVISFNRLRLIDWYKRKSIRPPPTKRPKFHAVKQHAGCESRTKKRHRWAVDCRGGKGPEANYYESQRYGKSASTQPQKGAQKGAKGRHGGKAHKKSSVKHVFYGYDFSSSKKTGKKKTESGGKGSVKKKGKAQSDRNKPFHFVLPPSGPSLQSPSPPSPIFRLPTPARPPLIVPLLGPTAAPSIAVRDDPITFPGASPTNRPTNSVDSTSFPIATPRLLTSSPIGVIVGTLAPFTASPTRRPTASPVAALVTQAPSSTAPTRLPTTSPVVAPVTQAPSSASPTFWPTASPVVAPVTQPPSRAPTSRPTPQPSTTPLTGPPSLSPTTESPTISPATISPTVPRDFELPVTTSPTVSRSDAMGRSPISVSPTSMPPTRLPTTRPTTLAPTQAPTTSPVASPKTSSPTSLPSKSPTKSPVTESPTVSPTGGTQETSEPTDSVEGIVVAASRFELDYDEFAATANEFPAAEEITLQYLQQFMESQFEMNIRTTLNGFRGTLVASNPADSVATYDISLIFDASSLATPTKEEVDLLVFAALNEPFVPTLIAALNALSSDNSFSQTATVTYTPGGRRSLREPL